MCAFVIAILIVILPVCTYIHLLISYVHSFSACLVGLRTVGINAPVELLIHGSVRDLLMVQWQAGTNLFVKFFVFFFVCRGCTMHASAAGSLMEVRCGIVCVICWALAGRLFMYSLVHKLIVISPNLPPEFQFKICRLRLHPRT